MKTLLKSVELSDAEFILSLRQDQRLNKHISPTLNDLEIQIEWLNSYFERNRKEEEYYFLIIDTDDNQPVGTVRVYNIEGQEQAEWGSWLIKPGMSPKIALESVCLVYNFIFNELGIKNAVFSVRNENKSVLRFHRNYGATELNQDESDSHFKLNCSDFLNVLNKLNVKVNMQTDV